MQVTTDIRPLAAALAAIKPAVARKAPLPVLHGIRLDAAGDGLTLTATDLAIAVTVAVPADVTKGGSLIVGHRDLADATTGKGRIELVRDGADLRAVNGVTSLLPRMSIDDWPKLPVGPWGEPVPLDVAATASVITAVGKDTTRPALCSVLLTGNRMVATDSYRLHVVSNLAVSYPEMLIPGVQLGHVLKALGNQHATIAVSADGRTVRVVGETTEFTVWTSPASFPSWAQLIRPSSTHHVTVMRPVFDQKVAALEKAARGDCSPLIIHEGSPVALSRMLRSGAVKKGEAPGHSPMKLAVNGGNLLDAIRGLSSCTIECADGLKPIIIRDVDGEGRLHERLLMPLRVD